MTADNNEETIDVDPDTWPRAELLGGPLDGHKILAPLPKYRAPLAIPLREPSDEPRYEDGYPPGEYDELNIRLHWYVPLTKHDVIRKLEVFFYAYAGETVPGEEMPSADELLDKTILADPQFPEDAVLEND